MSYDFHRQKPIDEYVVDFFCSKLNLIIEIDGNSHNEKDEEDQKRQKRLESLGFNFLRFLDSDVKQNMEGVLLTVKKWVNRYGGYTPKSPLDRGDLIHP